MGKVNERIVYRLPNGEIEELIYRWRLPGKGKGWLYVAQSGNCYWVFRNKMQRFCFDYMWEELDPSNRTQMIAAFDTWHKKYWDIVFNEAIAERVRKTRKGVDPNA